MNGSGCKNCPVKPCHTLHYRGSYCAEQRAKLGLGDPQTNADRIRAMSDEELCEFLCQYSFFEMCDEGCNDCTYKGKCDERLLEWLKQPADTHDNPELLDEK